MDDERKTSPRSKGAGLGLLCLLGGLIAAGAFAAISYTNLLSQSRSERDELVAMTAAFMKAFSEDRGRDGAVPATYRRRALTFFNNQAGRDDEGSRLSMTLPGRPGYEIETVAHDEQVRQIISDFQEKEIREKVVGTTRSDGRLIDRSIYPSVASSQSCVDCHNAQSSLREWKLGDVMGAFVVESDITDQAISIAAQAAAIFALAFFALSLIASRERRRMAEVVGALRAKVVAQDDKQAAEEKAHHLAYNDSLTGLANRARLNQYAEEIIKEGRAFSLFLIDLDDFKLVNDKYGHHVGDEVLIQVARRIGGPIDNAGGVAARIGGDEFAAIVPQGLKRIDPEELGRHIYEQIAQTITHEGVSLLPQASMGICDGSRDYTDVESLADIMRAADISLYAAKADNQKQVVLYSDQVGAEVRKRRELDDAVPAALANGEFELRFQPQLRMEDRTLHGFEALVRWRRDGRVLSPDEFVPIVEESGRICNIDIFVLREAARTLAYWNRRYGQNACLSVNLSPLHFRNGEIVDHVRDALNDSGLQPELLTLEITECVLIEAWEDVSQILSRLNALGIQLSLDDFGTGYSSLAYLRKLEVDEVKLDRAFLKEMDDTVETRSILDGIADIVLGMGRQLVVEGIETELQYEIVRSLGAQIGQGYLFARPLKPKDAETLLVQAAEASRADARENAA